MSRDDRGQDAAGYIVKVDDNFHYMDQTERWTLGRFPDCESAIVACKRLVDASLEEAYEPGMTPEALIGRYKMFGEDPFIVAVDVPPCEFSGWDYAEKRAREIVHERSGTRRQMGPNS